jgi:hypothetical protein
MIKQQKRKYGKSTNDSLLFAKSAIIFSDFQFTYFAAEPAYFVCLSAIKLWHKGLDVY